MIDPAIPWEPSVVVPLVLGAAGMLYALGSPGEPWSRQLAFWLAFLGFYTVSFTDFDYYAEHQFFLHRIQHGVLHHLSPFLFAISRPGKALGRALPRWLFVQVQALVNSPPVAPLIDGLNNPFVAAIVFVALIALWLTPFIHTFAMLDVRLYKLMNWSMAVNGLMFWSLALNNFALRPAFLSPMTRIVMMLGVVPPQIVIGLVLVFAGRDLYPVYALCGRIMALDGLADQQIGGVILWLSAMMMSVLGVLFILANEVLKDGKSPA